MKKKFLNLDKNKTIKIFSNIKDNLFFIVFLCSIVFFSLYVFVSEDKKVSTIENKVLVQKPTLSIENILNKSYMNDMEKYLSDQFFNRESFIGKANKYKIDLLLCKYVNDVFLGQDNYLFVRDTKKDFDQELIEKNISSLSSFLSYCEKNQIKTNVFLVPSSYEILDNKIDLGTALWFYQNTFDKNEYFKVLENKNNIDINLVDNILSKEKDNYIYYKTDHHWTTYGAYCLYKSEINKNISNYENETKIVSETFSGTTANKINIYNTFDTISAPIIKNEENVEVIYDMNGKNDDLYKEKYLNENDKYSYFLDGNHGFVEIKNKNLTNDKKTLVIKDSFANCFIPFMVNDYQQIDVIDLRYFNMPISNFLRINNYEEIYIIYNKTNFLKDKNIFKMEMK